MQLIYVLIFLDKAYIALRYIVTFKPKSWETITHNTVKWFGDSICNQR